MTYSRDFRNRVLKLRTQENLSMAEFAKRFGVGLAVIVASST